MKTRWQVTAIILAAGLTGYLLGQPGRLPPLNSDGQLAVFSKAKPNIAVQPEVINLQEAFANVASVVKPTVVSITTIHTQKVASQQEFFFGDPFEQFFQDFFNAPGQQRPPQQRRPSQPRQYQRRLEGMGSGVIISAEGYILTNEHVISGADEIKVLLSDGKTTLKGKLVGRDARSDLAVIKVPMPKNATFAGLGDSSRVRVGDWAIAVGSPFGLQQTVTVGVVSALNQSLQIENRSYRDFIQTDAAINRGNSGGPLVNIHGEVIGINTAIYAPTGVFSGVGFAIPINDAKDILDDLIHQGKVVRGWLGVELSSEIDEAVARAFGLPDKEGALVNKVLKDSPATRAGLQRGDVIREFGGKKIKNRDELIDVVSKTQPKKMVKVKIIRNRKPLELSLILTERPSWVDEAKGGPESEAPANRVPGQNESWKGLQVETLTESLASEFQINAVEKGVVVTDVSGDSPLGNYLTVGDLIKSVNGQATLDVKSFKKATSSAKLSQGAVFDIIRGGRPLYISVTMSE